MYKKSHLKPSRTSRQNAHQAQKRDEAQEIAELEKLCKLEADYSDIDTFSKLPISSKTKSGLLHGSFVTITDIQKQSIGPALAGSDILGAAQTGSGKTLAFIIPVIETLYKQNWSSMDGLGALIISPTRELATQIFQVLRKIGLRHTLSAGLITGGKSIEEEKEKIARMNILIATPGRLLQHLDQTSGFEVSNIEILVLDEADRLLDLGFEKTVNAILEHLPTSRQTLLFSATQTKSISALARVSLKPDHKVVSTYSKETTTTPTTLEQFYLVCELDRKLDILWSFIKTHLKTKCIVFMSSCKQVRFIYESFRHLQPGIPLLHFHGSQSTQKRLETFLTFTKTQHAILFCTDIAARGLDFPLVDWVIQLDCPEDEDTYIHRVGRTARAGQRGNGLLMLCPNEEEEMIRLIQSKEVPISKIEMDPKKEMSIKSHLQSQCSKDVQHKYLAQKAFVMYMRSIFLHRNKKIFDIEKYPAKPFAEALGLPGAPKMRFIKRSKALRNASRQMKAAGVIELPDEPIEESSETAKDNDSANIENDVKKEPTRKRKIDKMFEKKNLDVLSSHYESLKSLEPNNEDEGEDEEDLLQLARPDHDLEDIPDEDRKATKTICDVRKEKKKYKAKHGADSNSHKVFDEASGELRPIMPFTSVTDFYNEHNTGNLNNVIETHVDESKQKLRVLDEKDKERERLKRREKDYKKKQKLK